MQESVLYIVLALLCVVIYLLIIQRKNKEEVKTSFQGNFTYTEKKNLNKNYWSEKIFATGVQNIKNKVDKMSNILKKNGSEFYLVIYPWAETLVYGQKTFDWEKFGQELCIQEKCILVNSFDKFKERKNRNKNWYSNLYFVGDEHFNSGGNLIIANIEEAGFKNASNIYSISESSKFGGEIGWINNKFFRYSNNAGGIEGGMSNGEDIRIIGYLKPIPTLKKALKSVDMVSKEPFLAAHERSDTCTVPAAGIVGESMVALILAAAMTEKFGGDSIGETLRNYKGYLQQLHDFPTSEH